MKTILWAGLLAIGLGSAACRDEPESVAAGIQARGPGASGTAEQGADVGPRTSPGEPWVPGGGVEEQPGRGGAGQAGQAGIPQEWRGCARARSSSEPSSILTGTVREVSREALSLEDNTGQRMLLHADPSTCLLWEGQPMQPSQLSEGTAVRVSFEVDPQTGATARVVRVLEQQRPTP
jgi:hypothetical protein